MSEVEGHEPRARFCDDDGLRVRRVRAERLRDGRKLSFEKTALHMSVLVTVEQESCTHKKTSLLAVDIKSSMRFKCE